MNKNLIIFSYDYPPLDGGIARLCNEIAYGALDYYEKVIVLTREKEGLNKSYNTAHNITKIESRSKRIYCEWDCYKYLRSVKNKQDYDILCGLWHPEASIALLSGFQYVYTLAHGTELLSGKTKFKKYFWLPVYAGFILKKVKKVIANSNYTAGLANKITKDANVIPIPLSVNHHCFKPLNINNTIDGKLRLCSVSRILQFKAHDFVIHTISNLPENYKNRIEFQIAGKGPFLPQLQSLVKELKMESQVFFHGFIPDKELPFFYNQSDAFILCTRETENTNSVEGFGLVFLEAQSCGIPVIGARTGGIPDAITEENGGWLIEQDNEEELSALLMKLIDSPILIKEMGIKARKRVETFSTWQIYCEKLFGFMLI